MKLLLFGPPGVGKGTIGRLMEQAYNIPLVSMGDVVREEIKNETAFGKAAKEHIAAGQLISDEEIIALIIPKLQDKKFREGYILDGFPRSIVQAEACDKEGITFDAVIELEAPDETLIERLSTRRTCRKCDGIFNIITKAPKIEGVCDDCGGELYQRDDQKPEIIKERLNVYDKTTKPLINFYMEKKLLLKVSAVNSPPKILQDIQVLLRDVTP